MFYKPLKTNFFYSLVILALTGIFIANTIDASAQGGALRAQKNILLLPITAPSFEVDRITQLLHNSSLGPIQPTTTVVPLPEALLALTADYLLEFALYPESGVLELNLVLVEHESSYVGSTVPPTLLPLLSLLESRLNALPQLDRRLILNIVVTNCGSGFCIHELKRHPISLREQPITLLELNTHSSTNPLRQMLSTLSLAARIAASFERRRIAPWNHRTSAVVKWSRVLSNLPLPQNRALASSHYALDLHTYTTFADVVEAAQALPLTPMGHLSFIELTNEVFALGGIVAFDAFINSPMNNLASPDDFGVLYLRSILEDDVSRSFLAIQKLVSSPDLAHIASREFLTQALSYMGMKIFPNETPTGSFAMQVQAMRQLQQQERTNIQGEHWLQLAIERQEFSSPLLRVILVGTNSDSIAQLHQLLKEKGQERALFQAALMEIQQEREAIASGVAPRTRWLKGLLLNLILSQETNLVAIGRYMTLDLLANPPSRFWRESFAMEILEELARSEIAPEVRSVLARMAEASGYFTPTDLDEELARVRNEWFILQQKLQMTPLLAVYLHIPLNAWAEADHALICQEKLL